MLNNEAILAQENSRFTKQYAWSEMYSREDHQMTNVLNLMTVTPLFNLLTLN